MESCVEPRFPWTVPDWGPSMVVAGGLVAAHSRGPDAIAFTAPVHVAVLLLTPQPGRETALASDRIQRFLAPAGTLEIMPAGADFRGRWPVTKRNILFALEGNRLAYLADKEFSRSFTGIDPPKPGLVDDGAAQIAKLIQREMRSEEHPSALLIDSLLTAFSIHLLRDYAAGRNVARSRPRGGLSFAARRAVLGFMQERLAEPLSVAALAAEARLSPGYFLQAFRQTFGLPPHRYLRDLRARHAEKLVMETDRPLADIARAAGFASQSHMTTVLSRDGRMTPGRMRRLKRQADAG